MKIGRLEIEQLSEGHFLMTSSGWIERYRPAGPADADAQAVEDGFYEVAGIDPLLIFTGDTYVLVDAGLGLALDEKARDRHVSNLITNLEVLDIDPARITHVVLSHLHEDHVRGLTFNDRSMASTPTLPNATIYVQRAEWEYALSRYDAPAGVRGPEYMLDDLFKLVADGRFQFVDQEHLTLLPGIDLIRTGGHTPGHQLVRLYSGGRSAYFPGDLIPTSKDLNRYNSREYDVDPARARHQKYFWLKRIWDEQAVVFFYHNQKKKAARLTRNRVRLYDTEEARDE